MIFAFSLTNNRYRFHLFCVRFLKQWRRTGEIPISKHSTFVGAFLCFLYQQYGSWAGTSTKAGHTKGSVWFQCRANLPLTKLSKIQSIRNMTHTFDDMDSRGVTEVNLKKSCDTIDQWRCKLGQPPQSKEYLRPQWLWTSNKSELGPILHSRQFPPPKAIVRGPLLFPEARSN
jgi:hypothetical protein